MLRSGSASALVALPSPARGGEFPAESLAPKTPARNVRSPPSVRPRCSSEVAPSLCEGILQSFSPQRTCASTTPRCLPFLKHSMSVPSSLARGLPAYSGSAASRASFRPRRASTITDQQPWFTARKAMMNARMRGGARGSLPRFAARGTKRSASGPRWGTACQSSLNMDSCVSWVNPHLSQCSFLPMSTKGPSGSSWTYASTSLQGASMNTQGARLWPNQPPYITGDSGKR
mmetsp:Transcript_42596/g.121421  ORF Transcript_42596/g.121421 Transcript_42596/m.121421 type:complete len:231 (-) Transcript_42596:258-950(-)